MDLFFDNEFRTLIPPLQPEELTGLEASLIAEGNRDPVIIWKETRLLLDGHNRYDLCHKHNIELKPPIEMSFADRNAAIVWIIRNQFGRRNLNSYQRSVLALRLAEVLAPKAKQNISIAVGASNERRANPTLENSPKLEPIDTRAEIAKVAKVSDNTIAKVRLIEEKATPEQKAKLVAGTATINQVAVAIKREEVKEAVKVAVWPEGKFRIFYADPPWLYSNNMPSNFTEQRDHYPVMTIEALCALPVKASAVDNAVLFLWATSPILEDAFKVINAWGFTYKASFVWDKVRPVMGHYNSVRHEFLLIAVRGSCQPDVVQLFDSVQVIEKNGHSEKPEQFREIIKTLYPYGPRIELFARNQTDGWEVYGNQLAELPK